MKRIILLALLVVTGTMIIWSQVPQAMNYKAIAKDDWGVSLPNKTITLRFTILQDSETGAIVYQETHLTATNKFGLMDVEIGKGTPVIGSFDMINWSTGVYYIQIEMDPNGGTSFRLEDPAHQLLSVPYALFAETSGNGNFTETDPVFTSSSSSYIMSSDIFNWNTAFSWGNHANEGYLKNFTESDPMFLLHPAHGIASENISNWNTAFGWGNHSGLYKPLAYAPAWSEITENPFLLTSPEANQLLRFNSVSGKWENWIPDFLTIEVDGSVSNELQSLSQVLDLGNDAGVKNIINLADPINAQDAVTKSYVDALEARIAALEVVISGIIIDLDGDGYMVAGGDCNDTDPTIHPGAVEICGDGIDQDCDGEIDEDCTIVPEVCDGIDNDGDGQIDEGCFGQCYLDIPTGKWRSGNCLYELIGCTGTMVCYEEDLDNDGYTSTNDCNDNDASIFPGAPEICGDGIDQDCVGEVDEGCSMPISFNPNLTYGAVTDVENNTYKTIQIGTQTWMAENLKTTKYRNGDPILNAAEADEWLNCYKTTYPAPTYEAVITLTPAFCWYNNDEATYKNIYGALYNWYVVQTGNLCPTGWHVPTDSDWQNLTNYMGGAALAGGKLKEIDITHWNSPNYGATNESGFTALPGGWREREGIFHDIGFTGNWWSATETPPQPLVYVWNLYMGYNHDSANLDYWGAPAGMSVRCIKD